MGIHFSSSGLAWEKAFSGAVEFLEKTNGLVLLGPGIGESGKEWLEDHSLAKNPLRLGARVQDWGEWVKGRARANALGEGKPFKVLNQASQREFFRQTLIALTDAGAFHHLTNLWPEERFFVSLLACVEEARLAGLHEPSAIERAKEMLASGADAISREVYDDFWGLLLAFEIRLRASGDSYDKPALIRMAAAGGLAQDLYLLGFDQLSLLEVDLLQGLASGCEVYLPLPLSGDSLRALVSAKEISLDHTAAALVRGLHTGFVGEISLGEPGSEPAAARTFLLEGHAPSEEIRAAAALGRELLAEGKEVRYILPREELEECHGIFREEIGLPKNFHARKTLSHPVARLFFHALELKEKEYELSHSLEFAQLLQFTLGKFHDLPALATRAGVRKGLGDWQRKGESNPELAEFANFLVQMDGLIPGKALCVVYAQAVTKLAELCGIGELARLAHDRDAEKEAHAALSAVVRNAQMLGASVKEPLEFADWMRELFALLGSAKAGEGISFFPRLQFYQYGEWLPPVAPGAVTIALRFDASVGPKRSFGFYFEEGARRKLSDLLLPSQVQEELSFLDSVKRIGHAGTALFSWSKHDGAGKELETSWVASALPFEAERWPEVARAVEFRGDFRAMAEVRAKPEIKALSASLLELYKECPFRAFALKVLRLEDKMQASSLDVGPMELGSIVHRTLELYYGEHKGKNLPEAGRSELLETCLQQAVGEQKIEYFKGGADLLAVQVNRLRRMLLEFLAMDAENYQKFPLFRDPDVEVKVGGMIGPYPWKGKVDRIDIDDQNKRLLVIDYKTGATTPASSELKNLERFQLQLYLDAAEALHPGYEAAGGLYVSLRTGERKQGMVRKEFNRTKKDPEGGYFEFNGRTGSLKSEEEFVALREETRVEALRIAGGIHEGIFDVAPISDDACQRCEVRPACRIRELQAPARAAWPRVRPDFSKFLAAPPAAQVVKKSDKGFNEEQRDALNRAGELVFIEASAGTGKTTVIVEKIKRFLAERLAAGDASHRAVERFAAISFTEKSAQELGARVSQSLMQEEGMGPRIAAQAIRQISTIHGFCRKILSDFPVEAGISPMAGLLDEREAEAIRTLAFEDFFLHPTPEAKPHLDALFELFARAKIETFLRKILSVRLLVEADISTYQSWLKGETELPGSLVAAGVEKDALGHILALAEHFQLVYERLKKEKDVLDFNDLESLSLKVLRLPHAQKHYRERYSLLLVDEFQDTNSVQREILERIAQPEWKNLFVVGDAKQSIYRFRAADVSVFQTLRATAAREGNLVSLFRNYRSRKELVAAANQVTTSIFPAPGMPAPDFEAVAAEAEAFRGEGGRISVLEYGDPELKISASERREAEAELLVESVKAQLAKGREPGEIAVLMRKMSGNEAYLKALTHAGIPFRVGSSRGFYSQSVILDAIALLRSLYAASNDMALLAVLRSPWGGFSDEKILEIQQRGSARQALWLSLEEKEAPRLFSWKRESTFLSFSGLLEEAFRFYPLGRRDHLQTVKLLSILRGMEREAMPRVEMLERLSLWAGWEREEDSLDDSTMPEPGSGGAVQVMTVHSAKGLEFDVTILPDLASGALPDRSPLRVVPGVGMALKLDGEDSSPAYTEVGEKNKERDLAESKRLLYVAITRAKEECILLLPKKSLDKKEKKKETWADWLRGAEIGNAGIAAELQAKPRAPGLVAAPAAKNAPLLLLPRTATSITELAALQFCGEFHRRKFVQGWDDQVVALWPKPEGFFGAQKKLGLSPERVQALALLKKLGIQSKERGIALHRVLERVESQDLSLGELWLNEAYAAQGVEASEELSQLVALDLKLLASFLGSPLGQELFSEKAEAFPEISFQWKVQLAILHGAIDRLIRRPDGSWVVVDYKSSILEESRERYRFQVASYMAAVHAHAIGLGEKNPVVHGFLVDLYESKSYEVSLPIEEAAKKLGEEISALQKNYTLADSELALPARGISGGDHCFSCPYSLHCEFGRKFVLTFK